MFDCVTRTSPNAKFHAVMHGLALSLVAAALLAYAARTVLLFVGPAEVQDAPAERAPMPLPASVPLATVDR